MAVFSARTAATPRPAMIAPASAGPTRREPFWATLLRLTAAGIWFVCTISGISAAIAGMRIDSPMEIRGMQTSSDNGVIRPVQVSHSNTPMLAASQAWVHIIPRRRSERSAITPAGMTRNMIGSCSAVYTAATARGSASVMTRICQAQATSVIQNAVSDRVLATQSIENPGLLRGVSMPGVRVESVTAR